LLDQQAEAAANAATAEQGVKQEYRRTSEHFDDVDAGTPERRTFSIRDVLRISASPEDLSGSPLPENEKAPGHRDRRS